MSFWQGFEKTAAKHQKKIERAIAGKKDLHLTYRKANGRTVKRLVSPIKHKNGLLTSFDHKRNDYRTYRLDRLQAVKLAHADFTFGGLAAGSTLGAFLASRKNRKVLEELSQFKSENAKKLFQKMKGALPKGTQHLTSSDLRELIEEESDAGKKDILSDWKETVDRGNAFAIHPQMSSAALHDRLPDAVAHKKTIITGDKVQPAVLAHEAGHIIDYEEIAKSPAFKRFVKHLRSTVRLENAAWDKAPLTTSPDTQAIRDNLVGTYERGRNYTIAGALAGTLLGAATDHALDNLF